MRVHMCRVNSDYTLPEREILGKYFSPLHSKYIFLLVSENHLRF